MEGRSKSSVFGIRKRPKQKSESSKGVQILSQQKLFMEEEVKVIESE
jgi:hypothetical protein